MAIAVLLEADRLDEALTPRAATPGLLPAAGRPLVDHSARVLASLGDVSRVVLAGPTAYREQLDTLTGIDDAILLDAPLGSLVDALLERYGEAEELLLWRPNAPLLRPEMVELFLANAPLGAGLTFAVVREERYRQQFAELGEPSTGHLGPERIVWSPLMLVSPRVLGAHRQLLSRLLSDTVVHAELAKALGVGFAIKFTTGRATADELARRVGELLEAPCVIEFSPYAELAVRVRTRGDYHVVRNVLEAS